MFRIAQDPTRYGLTLKMIAADSGLNSQSVRNYAAGETEMPLSALDALIGVMPSELLSLLLPGGYLLMRAPDGVDYDEYEKHCRTFLSLKGEAHRHDSPDGRDISVCEDAKLKLAVVPLRAVG
jgi:predicted transcriptional regulator